MKSYFRITFYKKKTILIPKIIWCWKLVASMNSSLIHTKWNKCQGLGLISVSFIKICGEVRYFLKFFPNSFLVFWLCVLSHSVLSDSLPPHGGPLSTGFSRILQAGMLEWVAIPFSRGSFQLKNKPESPALQADSLPFFSHQGSPVFWYW